MSNEPKPAAQETLLPQEIRDAIDALRPRYPTSEALLLPALHMAQKHWGGWLPEPVLEAIADELDLSPAKVYGVVTFYDLFHQQPVGRHRVRVCTNLSCELRGSREVVAAIQDELGVGEGEVTSDDRVSFVEFECLGACDSAPMMMVDDDYHGQLTPERALELLRDLD